MSSDKGFLGRGWSFPPSFNINSAQTDMVDGDEDISQSVQIILSTSLGERNMHPDFGCDLSRFLFEEIDETLVSNLSDIVSNALIEHEPRIDIDKVLVEPSDVENGLITIAVNYIIVATNTRANLVYPFYINEGTDASI
ncbi:MAG: GPW/gp25 family protein [Gammaproteobacteria bacterium]|nr:GPW/gp25 family protein [Gammaproteobacteria bacterium]